MLSLYKTLNYFIPIKYILNNGDKLELIKYDLRYNTVVLKNGNIIGEWSVYGECNKFELLIETNKIYIYTLILYSLNKSKLLDEHCIKDFYPKIKLISKLTKINNK